MNSREIEGKPVLGSNGWKIGKAKDIVFDERTWRVLSLDVELEKDVAREFDMQTHFHKTHVEMNVSYIQAIGDAIILNTSKEDLFKFMVSQQPATPAAAPQVAPAARDPPQEELKTSGN